jgi:putative endonuclease
MPFWTYILRSDSTRKIYIGHTSDLGRRLDEHNNENVGNLRYTRKQKGPWRLIHSEQFSNRSQAMKREKQLKGGQGRQWIKDYLDL